MFAALSKDVAQWSGLTFHQLEITHGPFYNSRMNTTISLPDALLTSADELAAEQGLSRDEWIAQAVEFYTHRQRSKEEITAALDAIYGSEPSTLDPTLAAAQSRVLPKDDWK